MKVRVALVAAIVIGFVLVHSTAWAKGAKVGSAPPAISSATIERVGTVGLRNWPSQATVVATDDGSMVWGGESITGGGSKLATGEVYNAVLDVLRSTAPSPLSPRSDAAGLWTGSEVVLVGGIGPHRAFTNDAAAYNPATETWRELPALPASVLPEGPIDFLVSPVQQIVWTGSRVVIPQLALELRRDGTRWRRIAKPPPPLARVDTAIDGTRRRVLLLGSEGLSGPEVHASELDLRKRKYTEIPVPPISLGGLSAIAVPYGWLVVNSTHEAARYDRREGEWTVLPAVPGEQQECGTTDGTALVDIEGAPIVNSCSEFAVFDTARNTWTEATTDARTVGHFAYDSSMWPLPGIGMFAAGGHSDTARRQMEALRLRASR